MSGGPWTAQELVPEFFHCTGHRSERTSWGKQRYDHRKHKKDFDASHASIVSPKHRFARVRQRVLKTQSGKAV
jgi:hypothetical protein